MALMNHPTVTISDAALKRVRNFDGWVFANEVTRAEPEIPAGTVVEIRDTHGAFAALAFYNAQSHIPLRIISLNARDTLEPSFWRQRLQRAVAHRAGLRDTNAKRLVFSEADGLPGLIVDQYDQHLVVQFRSAGMDRLRAIIVDLLQETLRPKGMLERSDKEFRQEEGLPLRTEVLTGAVPDRIRIHEGPLQFWVDPHQGLKTGFYLDQRPTRERLRAWVKPGTRVLDAFSYTGSMGIAAASAGAQVVCVEQQEACLALAKENAILNHVEDRMEFVAGDAFYWLEAKTHATPRYDWVIVDPPGLAKGKPNLTKARQALHHLVVNGLGLAKPDGQLLLSICSYHLLGLTEEIVRIAAAKLGQRLRVRDQWLQAEDHPWMLQMPATRYLVSWWFSLDGQSTA